MPVGVKRRVFWLFRFACTILTLLFVQMVVRADPPQTDAEWDRFGNELLDLFHDGDFPAIIRRADAIGRETILDKPGHYLPKACIANALAREEHYHESLDFYEETLNLSLHNLGTYCEALKSSVEFDRGLNFLRTLRNTRPSDGKAIDDAVTNLSFFATVAEGDEKYLAGDKAGALELYEQAKQQYDSHLLVKMNPQEQAAYASRFMNGWNEYTYTHEYDAPDGLGLTKYMIPTFLKPKMELCKWVESQSVQATVLRVAILAIRNTDFPYVVSNKVVKTVVQREKLDGAGWERRRRAWLFASDAIEMYSAGKIKITTTYIDLPNVTVIRVDDHMWKNLVHVRHLDPAGLMPSQSALFEKLVKSYDIIIFAWNGGAGASAYGGGPIPLPGLQGKLPLRGCVRRMPSDSVDMMHEFLHNMERRAFPDAVHGPQQPPWVVQAAQYHLLDEFDWYAHLLSEIQNPEAAKYLH